MGTINEWLLVLVASALWGGIMAWRDASKEPLNKTRRGWVLFAVDHMTGGPLFGILLVFQWRAFHQPVVYITIAAVAGMFISGLLVRKHKQKRTNSDEKNLLSIPPHLR
jgi:hypothetical protein